MACILMIILISDLRLRPKVKCVTSLAMTMSWSAALALYLVAGTAALGSDLKFTAKVGGELAQTSIAWDGSTL